MMLPFFLWRRVDVFPCVVTDIGIVTIAIEELIIQTDGRLMLEVPAGLIKVE
jgi:proline racemase